MRDPKIVLKQLTKLDKNQSVNNLYKNLYNLDFYKIAYNNIYSKSSQMTLASDNSNIDGISEERINKVIQKLRDKTYKPTLLKSFILKNNSNQRVNVSKFEDKLIQEIIRMILEAIYEHTFKEFSHGFRPKKSCHTALKYAQQKFGGTKWWIRGDIKECFSNINHEILLNILKKKIREQKFIHLINLFLKNGYLENQKSIKTYSGISQGSIIGPILANIYLNEFDSYMEELIQNFNIGTRREENKEYNNICSYIYKAKIAKTVDKKRIKDLRNERKKIPRYNFHDENFKRLSYIRYADDFLIGIIGSKKETNEIFQNIKKFLNNKLKLELNLEKTKILHHKNKVDFLGYELSVMESSENLKINGGIALWLPYNVCKDFIIKNRYGKYVNNKLTGKQEIKAIHRPEMILIGSFKIKATMRTPAIFDERIHN